MLLTELNLPWTSPILGVRFEMFEDGLALFYPNGESFEDPETVFEERDRDRDQLARALAKLQELGVDLDEV